MGFGTNWPKTIEKKNQFRCPLTVGVKFYTEGWRTLLSQKNFEPSSEILGNAFFTQNFAGFGRRSLPFPVVMEGKLDF